MSSIASINLIPDTTWLIFSFLGLKKQAITKEGWSVTESPLCTRRVCRQWQYGQDGEQNRWYDASAKPKSLEAFPTWMQSAIRVIEIKTGHHLAQWTSRERHECLKLAIPHINAIRLCPLTKDLSEHAWCIKMRKKVIYQYSDDGKSQTLYEALGEYKDLDFRNMNPKQIQAVVHVFKNANRRGRLEFPDYQPSTPPIEDLLPPEFDLLNGVEEVQYPSEPTSLGTLMRRHPQIDIVIYTPLDNITPGNPFMSESSQLRCSLRENKVLIEKLLPKSASDKERADREVDITLEHIFIGPSLLEQKRDEKIDRRSCIEKLICLVFRRLRSSCGVFISKVVAIAKLVITTARRAFTCLIRGFA